jgi:glycosyltransferase involved in cell wall biosynthesis
LPEVVGDGSGVLVPPFELDALARATASLLADGARRAQLGQEARARALAQFRREPAIDRYETVFQRALRRSERGTTR